VCRVVFLKTEGTSFFPPNYCIRGSVFSTGWHLATKNVSDEKHRNKRIRQSDCFGTSNHVALNTFRRTVRANRFEHNIVGIFENFFSEFSKRSTNVPECDAQNTFRRYHGRYNTNVIPFCCPVRMALLFLNANLFLFIRRIGLTILPRIFDRINHGLRAKRFRIRND